MSRSWVDRWIANTLREVEEFRGTSSSHLALS